MNFTALRGETSFSNKLSAIVVTLLVFSLISGCDACARKRAYGYLRLGNVKNFLGPETYLEAERLLIKRDKRGLSAMSTMCTKDLSPLKRKKTSTGFIFESEITASRYDYTGKVLSGPASIDLPRYQLVLSALTIEDPMETLYVKIGIERPADWRLPVVKEKE